MSSALVARKRGVCCCRGKGEGHAEFCESVDVLAVFSVSVPSVQTVQASVPLTGPGGGGRRNCAHLEWPATTIAVASLPPYSLQFDGSVQPTMLITHEDCVDSSDPDIELPGSQRMEVRCVRTSMGGTPPELQVPIPFSIGPASMAFLRSILTPYRAYWRVWYRAQVSSSNPWRLHTVSALTFIPRMEGQGVPPPGTYSWHVANTERVGSNPIPGTSGQCIDETCILEGDQYEQITGSFVIG